MKDALELLIRERIKRIGEEIKSQTVAMHYEWERRKDAEAQIYDHEANIDRLNKERRELSEYLKEGK